MFLTEFPMIEIRLKILLSAANKTNCRHVVNCVTQSRTVTEGN